MYESFSQDTKNEICSYKSKMKCCRVSMLYGMMYGAAFFGADRIQLDTENPTVAMLYTKLIREFVPCRRMSDAQLINISSGEVADALLSLIGVEKREDISVIRRENMKCEFCGWSFVRGVFLSCGTITSPGNAYHLEFLMRDEKSANQLAAYLELLGTPPKITERGETHFGVYYKDSESIVDLLGHLGANRAAFEILNVKIYKDIRNNANRVSNCELANIGKTIAAANEQMRAIETIIQSGRADDLPEELRQTLDLRAAFPDATLSELADRHVPAITKSGVNHRLRRLIDFAKKC